MPDEYVRTETVLDKILEHKVGELAARKASAPQRELEAAVADASPPRDFCAALREAALERATVALIAEVKRASPSRGVLIDPFAPVQIGMAYAEHGAAAISVLTDEHFFQGHLDHLAAVRRAVNVPVLRKDFVIDPYQVYEGRAAGADAILLIAAALRDSQLAALYTLITQLGMTALVEVHNAAELARVAPLQPALIGINNRDLRTFDVDLATTLDLAAEVPPGALLVAESGIFNGTDVRRMGAAGAHAVLVGEALVRSGNIAAAVHELSRQPRPA